MADELVYNSWSEALAEKKYQTPKSNFPYVKATVPSIPFLPQLFGPPHNRVVMLDSSSKLQAWSRALQSDSKSTVNVSWLIVSVITSKKRKENSFRPLYNVTMLVRFLQGIHTWTIICRNYLETISSNDQTSTTIA